LKVEEATLGGFELEATLRVSNPNRFDLRIDYLEVGLEVSGNQLGAGSTSGFTVGKFSHKEVAVPFYVSTFGLAGTIMKIIQSEEFDYRMTAEVTYKTQEGSLRRHLETSGSLGD